MAKEGDELGKHTGGAHPQKEGGRFRPLFFSSAPLGVSLIVANLSGLGFLPNPLNMVVFLGGRFLVKKWDFTTSFFDSAVDDKRYSLD